MNIDFGFPFVPDTSTVIELKISNRGFGFTHLVDFNALTFPDTTYNYIFFKRINLLIATKKLNESNTTMGISLS